MSSNTVRLHRVLRTTPERVYRAFLDADAMAKWLPPNGFTGKVHQMDPKVAAPTKMSFMSFTFGKSTSFGGKYLSRAVRTPALHGYIRRPESPRRNPGDNHVEESVLRDGDDGCAGRYP